MGRIKRVGPADISTAEAIATILGQKNTITANRVMEQCNGLYGILRTDYSQLAKIDVLDHMIIGHNRYVSLRERDLGFEAA